MPADYRKRIEEGRPRLYATARDVYGLEMNPGPFGVDTRPALIGAKFAEAHGFGERYHARIMRGYWQEGQKIDDLEALQQLAADAGLDVQEFRQALHEEEYDQQVQTDINTAVSYGLNGVPALVFDNKYLVSGAQPLDVLTRVVEKIQNEQG